MEIILATFFWLGGVLLYAVACIALAREMEFMPASPKTYAGKIAHMAGAGVLIVMFLPVFIYLAIKNRLS